MQIRIFLIQGVIFYRSTIIHLWVMLYFLQSFILYWPDEFFWSIFAVHLTECLRKSYFKRKKKKYKGYNLHFCLHCHLLLSIFHYYYCTTFRRIPNTLTTFDVSLSLYSFYVLPVKSRKIIMIKTSDLRKSFSKKN